MLGPQGTAVDGGVFLRYVVKHALLRPFVNDVAAQERETDAL